MRVVVAEDETLLREGLVLVLGRAGIDVVGTSPDADHLRAIVGETEPDLVITDIRMPPGRGDDGLQAAIEIRQQRPGTGVIVLSQFVQRRYAIELVGEDPSGVGYLLKERVADVDRFIAVLHQVADGGTVLDPEVVQVMLARASRCAPGSTASPCASARSSSRSPRGAPTRRSPPGSASARSP